MGLTTSKEADPLVRLLSVTDKDELFSILTDSWDTPRATPAQLICRPIVRAKTMTLRAVLYLRDKPELFAEAVTIISAIDLTSALRLLPFSPEAALCILACLTGDNEEVALRRAAIQHIVVRLHTDLRAALAGGTVTSQARYIPRPHRGLNKERLGPILTTTHPDGKVDVSQYVQCKSNTLYRTLAASFGRYNAIQVTPLVRDEGIIGGSQRDFRIHVLGTLAKATISPQLHDPLPSYAKGETKEGEWHGVKCVVIPSFLAADPKHLNIAAHMVQLCDQKWLSYSTKLTWQTIDDTIDIATAWRMVPLDTKAVYIISNQPSQLYNLEDWEGPPLIYWHLTSGPACIKFCSPSLTLVTGIDPIHWAYMTTTLPEPTSYAEHLLNQPPYVDIHYGV